MTVTFWSIAAAMTIVVLGLILRPLLKRPVATTGEQEKTLPVYRQQFAELLQDRTSGLLSEEQYRVAREELERRLLEETGSMEIAVPTGGNVVRLRLVALALGILIPTISGVLYWTLGDPAAMTHTNVSAMSSPQTSDEAQQMAEGLNVLIDRLKKKLEENPSDAVGWTLLARSYMAMERYNEAVPIFDKAVKLNPDDANLLADYADALAVHQGRKLEGRPEALIQKALKLDPNNVKALMLSGTVAFNRQNFGEAVKDWEHALANLPSETDPESTEQLTASIGEAKRRMGGGAPLMMAANRAPSTPEKPAAASKAGGGRAITGKVVLGPGMAGKGSPTDTLFVFAKDPSGPPMPVSIVRASRQDLPFTFRLDDSTSPMPSRKLSDIESVVIVARLSKSGKAMPESGDLEGMSQPIKPGTEGVTVVIDRQR